MIVQPYFSIAVAASTVLPEVLGGGVAEWLTPLHAVAPGLGGALGLGAEG